VCAFLDGVIIHDFKAKVFMGSSKKGELVHLVEEAKSNEKHLSVHKNALKRWHKWYACLFSAKRVIKYHFTKKEKKKREKEGKKKRKQMK
jgi:hypothetical protein